MLHFHSVIEFPLYSGLNAGNFFFFHYTGFLIKGTMMYLNLVRDKMLFKDSNGPDQIRVLLDLVSAYTSVYIVTLQLNSPVQDKCTGRFFNS